MTAEFLGHGWRFPLELENGSPAMVSYEESIRQSIWMILSTAPGERVMRPDFGCGIHRLVFGLSNSALLGTVMFEVRQSLLRFEPRVDVHDVRAIQEGSGERLAIYIEYEVRTTNSRFNLVYPFYLDRSTV